jgi:hypothetical protein
VRLIDLDIVGDAVRDAVGDGIILVDGFGYEEVTESTASHSGNTFLRGGIQL